jgi:hypothetical protein
MNLIEKYNIYIYERYNDLKRSQKETYDNYDLAKIFEYYTAIQLNKELNQVFYEYQDIDPNFKEAMCMSKNDTGIDLSNLQDTIVQCKLRSNILTWSEMSTFFASNIKEGLAFKWPKYVVARNDDCQLSRNLKGINWFTDKTYNKNNMIEYCESLLQNPPVIIQQEPKMELRDYQMECLDLIQNTENLVVCLPTGCGKGLIIIRSLNVKGKYLILVPRIILMDQLKSEIIKHTKIKASSIQLIGDNCTKFDETKCVTICVYNSIPLIYDRCDIFDKIFVDEAHHIYLPQIYENDTDDSDEEVVAEKDTYITKIQSLSKFNNNVYLSATIDKIEGFDFYKKDIREMIEKGYLCDYTIHVPIFSDTASNKSICEYLLQNYRNIIIYCQSQKEGKEVNKILNTLMSGSSCYIDANTSKVQRNKILSDYKLGIIPFLVNVKVLVEGFDAPITRGVCLLHNTSSQTTLIQILGRALRLHPTKTYANIILPFSIEDDGKNINQFMGVLAKNDIRIRTSYVNKNLGGYINIKCVDNTEDENGYFRYENVYNNLGVLLNSEEQWLLKFETAKKCIDLVGNIQGLHVKYNSSYNWIYQYKIYYNKHGHIMNNNPKINEIWVDFIFNSPYSMYFKTEKEKWLFLYEKFKACLDTLHKRPTVKDIEHKDIFNWMTANFRNYKDKSNIMNDTEIYNIWHNFMNDEPYNIYFNAHTKWYYRRDNLQLFINTNNKLPSHNKNISADEIKLNKFLCLQKEAYKSKKWIMKNDVIYNEWTKFLETNKKYFKNDYRTDYITVWKNNLSALNNYTKEFDELPKRSNKTYKYLAIWTTTQQCSNFKVHPELKVIWDNFIHQPHIAKHFILNKDIWLSNFNILNNYYNINDVFPDKNIELMLWYRINRDSYINKTGLVFENSQCKELWEKFMNDDNIDHQPINMSNTERWKFMLKKINEFIYAYKRLPSNPKNKREHSYMQWLTGQYKNYRDNKKYLKIQDIKNTWIQFVTGIIDDLAIEHYIFTL